LDELFEILTWRQLGLHEMPIGILNVNGFFDDLLKMIQKMVTEGFLKEINLNMFVVDATPEGLMEKLENYIPQGEVVGKWIGRG
jgi:predicted Rossmann-fold nucleotide-binding protein